jgi:glycosyltransferase involved in cell wall biosynthesis
MKICYLGDAPSPHVRKIVDYFAKESNEIYIISLRKAEYHNAHVYQIPRRTPFDDLNYLLGYFWLRKIIKSINPDVLHAHYLTSFGLLGALVKYHPYIVTIWGTDLLVTPRISFIHKWLLRFTLRKTDLIFVDANFMREELLQYGAEKEKILICPFGVDMEIFCTPNRGFKEKTEYEILSMRALIKNSNVDMIIRALEIMKKKGIKIVLNITNQGTEEEFLKQLVIILKLNDQVNFLGFIKLEDTYRHLESSDVYLSVPTSDGASVTLLEAMASGLFPIVSDIPANREWIKDGVNGFLVPLNDPVTLAEKIILALKQHEFRSKAAKINQDLIRKQGELNQTMGLIWDQYQMLVDSNRK